MVMLMICNNIVNIFHFAMREYSNKLYKMLICIPNMKSYSLRCGYSISHIRKHCAAIIVSFIIATKHGFKSQDNMNISIHYARP